MSRRLRRLPPPPTATARVETSIFDELRSAMFGPPPPGPAEMVVIQLNKIKEQYRLIEQRQRDRDERQCEDTLLIRKLLRDNKKSEAKWVARRVANRQTYALSEQELMLHLEHVQEQLGQAEDNMTLQLVFERAAQVLDKFNRRIPAGRMARIRAIYSRNAETLKMKKEEVGGGLDENAPDEDEEEQKAGEAAGGSSLTQHIMDEAAKANRAEDGEEQAAADELALLLAEPVPVVTEETTWSEAVDFYEQGDDAATDLLRLRLVELGQQ